MKKLIFFIVLVCLTAILSFGQKQRQATPVNPAPKKIVQPAASPAVSGVKTNEIREADWLKMADAMYQENWEKSSALAAQNLQKLKTENAKKQLAQLRYVYLYSLAGKVSEGKMPFAEFERIAGSFVGQEFLLVSRQLLADCATKVNYICASKTSDRVLRVTATNRAGTAIHLFEYVALEERFDVRANNEKLAFLGGYLKKVESNLYKSDLKIMRLIFDKGYVKVATD
ncbi:MAG TPA: hypothetical protein VK400_02220 [Pyrinomonadaceae bacterium]|nr:hypothetical protein [Pyrinomonadaceae bacterium]